MSAASAFRVRLLDETDSTSNVAREAAVAGEPGGLWIIARRQTAGRGRTGHIWQSPRGNFYGSLLLRLDHPLKEVATLSLVTGLAVAETIHALSDERLLPRLKWPNDVLIDGAKVSGILLEGGDKPGQRGCWVVIGIGLNLVWAPDDLPYPATSLAAQGVVDLTPERFLDAFTGPFRRRFEQWRIGGFGVLRDTWMAAAVGVGQLVRLRHAGREHRGRFADLGPDGSLLLDFGGERFERFAAGEILISDMPPNGVRK